MSAPRPDDVFRRPWQWRPVTREEACSLCSTIRVVVVFRPAGATTVAEWLTPSTTFYASYAPYSFRYASYYVYDEKDQQTPLSAPQPDKGGPDAGPPPEDEEVPASEIPDGPDREEEVEPDTMPPETEPVTTAGVLTNAAKAGVPFCEICAKMAAAGQ
jgi:hypothetical protein